MHNILDTHFARAIRKYGPDKWQLEVIDGAETQEELNQKEQYWIRYYNSVEEGYNETDAINKCGGNTYQSKTEEEMEEAKSSSLNAFYTNPQIIDSMYLGLARLGFKGGNILEPSARNRKFYWQITAST